jgi:hypothetical protein
VVEAMLDWRRRYGRLPSSYDWSRTHARRRGGEALERFAEGERPAASIVTRLFGTWVTARAVATERAGAMRPTEMASVSSSARESISLPKPRESTAKTEDRRGGATGLQQRHLQGFSVCGSDFAHNSGR